MHKCDAYGVENMKTTLNNARLEPKPQDQTKTLFNARRRCPSYVKWQRSSLTCQNSPAKYRAAPGGQIAERDTEHVVL